MEGEAVCCTGFFPALSSFVQGIAWPVLVGGVLWYFRDEIGNVLAERGWQLGPKGLKVEPPSQQSAALPTDVGKDHLPTGTAQNIPPFTQTISGDQLNPVIQAFRQIAPPNVSDAARADYYLAASAALHIQLQHERHYIAMFGSQLALLKRLNEVGDVGLPLDFIRAQYHTAAVQYPDVYKTFSFEQWAGFLVNTGLAIQRDDRGVITPYGRGFLQYLVLRQLSELKPF